MSEFKRPVLELREFIAERPAVAQALTDCWEPIQRIFGAGTSIHIALESDPDGSLCVHANIEWEGDYADARTKLAEFDEKWWLGHCGSVGSDLMFNCELVDKTP